MREQIEPLDLPRSWVWTSVGEIYDIVGGGTPSTNNPEYWTGEIPWITSADIFGLKDIRPRRFITNDAIKESATNVVPVNSLIVVTRVGLGKVALAKSHLCFSQDSQALIPTDLPINPLYSLYYLSKAVQIFKYKHRGTTIAGVTKKQLSALSYPLAPLPEQHRIVARIEELFSRLDAGVEALQKAKAQLRRYRQAVLKAAVEGRLTEEWRKAHPEVEPAKKSLERVDNERKSQLKEKYKNLSSLNIAISPGLKESWALTTINHVAECLDYKRVPINKKERVKRVGSIPYYGANGQVGWIDDFLFDESLILVVEDETFTGREKPFSYKITGKSWVNNHAHVLRATAAVDINYLNYSLEYYPFTPLTTGTTGRKKLTQLALMSAAYALPPLAEQKEIVKDIELNLSISDRVEENIKTSIRYSNTLRQSILKRAFEGRLVPQDPSDEPASMLIERIKAERSSSSPIPTKSKRHRAYNSHQMRLTP